MVNASLKISNPEKYKRDRKKANEYMRKYNKKYPERLRETVRKHYIKIKNDPVKYDKLKKQIYASQKKRYKRDPVFREKMKKWNRNYREKLKQNDPDKYRIIFKHRKAIQPFVCGLKCKCEKSFITQIAGRSKKSVKCPHCGMRFFKHELEKVKIPRNLPKDKI